MKTHFVLLLILFSSMQAHARLPYGTGLGEGLAQLVTCRLDGFSRDSDGPRSSVYLEVKASSVEEALRNAVADPISSVLNPQGDVKLLKFDTGLGQVFYAESIVCGNVYMQVTECCRAVC